MNDYLVAFFLSIPVSIYFSVRGALEGMLFSEDGIEAGKYHFLRLIESFSVLCMVIFVSYFFGDFRLLSVFFFGLALYELNLSYSQYGVFPPLNPFVYKLFSFEIFVTPTLKLVLLILYVLIGAIILNYGG